MCVCGSVHDYTLNLKKEKKKVFKEEERELKRKWNV